MKMTNNKKLKYYTIVNKEKNREINERNYLSCRLDIKWNVNNIVGSKQNNGYIVQRVKIQSNISKAYITPKIYFEAWKVADKKIAYKDDYDDSFNFNDQPLDHDVFYDCIGKKGYIKWEAIVYWINESTELSATIDQWKEGAALEAGSLQSAHESDISEETSNDFKNYFKFKRKFIHEFDLKGDEEIIFTLKKYFSKIPLNKDNYDLIEKALKHVKNKEHFKEQITSFLNIS